MSSFKEKRYEEALGWIHGLGRFGIKPGLERMHAMLEMLGNPHRNINFVHIAGTNGKGSTAAVLASVLKSSGCRVGLFTSPYLLSFTNRMAVGGADIEHDQLVELVDLVKPLVERLVADPALGQPTEFEVVTVLAFAFFARQKVDLVILEAGLGGRLDATNVVSPLVSVITNISLEHTEVLGDTIEKIAFEKAGIIKLKVPLVTAALNEEVLALFKKRCAELNSEFYRVYPAGTEPAEEPVLFPAAFLSDITAGGQYFSYRGLKRHFENLFLPLRGKYQLDNAATALVVLELLEINNGFTFSDEQIAAGLAATSWPGRLEKLQRNPLVIMDGAHNPQAMEKLVEALPVYFNYSKLLLVLGVLDDKDTEKMLKSILPLADTVIFTKPTLQRAADPQKIADFALNKLSFQGKKFVVSSFAAAFEEALQLAGPTDAVLVTGSLYLVSDIRAYWLKTRQRV